jgi:hypothetical protein
MHWYDLEDHREKEALQSTFKNAGIDSEFLPLAVTCIACTAQSCINYDWHKMFRSINAHDKNSPSSRHGVLTSAKPSSHESKRLHSLASMNCRHRDYSRHERSPALRGS